MRDKFDKLLRDALKLQIWTHPIPVKVNHAIGGGAGVMGGQLPSTSIGGITGIKKQIEQKTEFSQKQITTAFQDLDSLKEKARGLVTIANQIKTKIQKKEVNVESDEMKEIQSVMFNMGLISDFSS